MTAITLAGLCIIAAPLSSYPFDAPERRAVAILADFLALPRCALHVDDVASDKEQKGIVRIRGQVRPVEGYHTALDETGSFTAVVDMNLGWVVECKWDVQVPFMQPAENVFGPPWPEKWKPALEAMEAYVKRRIPSLDWRHWRDRQKGPASVFIRTDKGKRFALDMMVSETFSPNGPEVVTGRMLFITAVWPDRKIARWSGGAPTPYISPSEVKVSAEEAIKKAWAAAKKAGWEKDPRARGKLRVKHCQLTLDRWGPRWSIIFSMPWLYEGITGSYRNPKHWQKVGEGVFGVGVDAMTGEVSLGYHP